MRIAVDMYVGIKQKSTLASLGILYESNSLKLPSSSWKSMRASRFLLYPASLKFGSMLRKFLKSQSILDSSSNSGSCCLFSFNSFIVMASIFLVGFGCSSNLGSICFCSLNFKSFMVMVLHFWLV